MTECKNDAHIDDDELGKVVYADPSIVRVERLALEGCKSCSMGSFCGTKNNPLLTFKNTQDLKQDDIVVIHINASVRLLSSFIIFILPIILIAVSFSVAHYVFLLKESLSIIIAFLSIIPSAIIIKLFDKFIAKNKSIQISKKEMN